MGDEKFAVLLVEDHRPTARTNSRLLRREGFSCTVALCVERAKQLLSLHRFDAMVLDMFLPDPDGLALIHELREQGELIPILVLSGYPSAELRIDALDAGAQDFILKAGPAAPAEWAARIRRAICDHHGRTASSTSRSERAGTIESHSSSAGARITIELQDRCIIAAWPCDLVSSQCCSPSLTLRRVLSPTKS